MPISKRQKTAYNHFTKVRSSIHDLFRITRTFQLDFDKYLELKNKMYLDHPSLKKLNTYYRGYLEGISDTLFHTLQTEWVEWLHCYESHFNRPIYTNKWEQIPLSIRLNKSLIKSNHYWKNPKKWNHPNVWGTNPETF